jgi:hypothetical protein
VVAQASQISPGLESQARASAHQLQAGAQSRQSCRPTGQPRWTPSAYWETWGATWNLRLINIHAQTPKQAVCFARFGYVVGGRRLNKNELTFRLQYGLRPRLFLTLLRPAMENSNSKARIHYFYDSTFLKVAGPRCTDVCVCCARRNRRLQLWAWSSDEGDSVYKVKTFLTSFCSRIACG